MTSEANRTIHVALDMGRLLTLHQPAPDSVLFHYTSTIGLLGIFESCTFWATQIQYLNDSAELQDGVRLAAQYINDATVAALAALPTSSGSPDSPNKSFFLERLEAVLGTYRDSPIFVVSFSEEPDLLSQWRAYCPRGGFSLGFKPSAISGFDTTWRLVQCVYDAAEKRRVIVSLIDAYVDSYMKQSGSQDELRQVGFSAAADFAKELYAVLPGMKHVAFSEEKEWRLVSPPGLSASDWRTTASTLVPFRRLPFLREGDPLDRVIVGPNPHQQLAIHSSSTFLADRGFKCTHAISRVPFRQV